jgi:predicted HTH domain antitoxin
MQRQHDSHTEAALYWAAVSLIVCDGLSIEKAADRLGVEAEELTHILHRRQSPRPSAFADSPRWGSH